jgi:hypothetical protein
LVGRLAHGAKTFSVVVDFNWMISFSSGAIETWDRFYRANFINSHAGFKRPARLSDFFSVAFLIAIQVGEKKLSKVVAPSRQDTIHKKI